MNDAVGGRWTGEIAILKWRERLHSKDTVAGKKEYRCIQINILSTTTSNP
jgi:hypothetical protein